MGTLITAHKIPYCPDIYACHVSSKYIKVYKIYGAHKVSTLSYFKGDTQNRRQGRATIPAHDTLSRSNMYAYQLLSIYLKGFKSYSSHKLSLVKFAQGR